MTFHLNRVPVIDANKYKKVKTFHCLISIRYGCNDPVNVAGSPSAGRQRGSQSRTEAGRKGAQH